MQPYDSTRRIAALRDDIRRLRARARRWGAAETADALEEALARSEAELGRARDGERVSAGGE